MPKAKITPEQDEVLKRYRSEGLTSTGAASAAKIQAAADETGLPFTVVSNRVSNMNRPEAKTHKKKAVDHRSSKGLNAFHLYCSSTPSSSSDRSERMKAYASGYAALPLQERLAWNERADKEKMKTVDEMTEDERFSAIKKHTKSLGKTFNKLEELRADGLCYVTQKVGAFAAASGKGETVLDNNVQRLEREFFVAPATVSKPGEIRRALRASCRTKNNARYMEFFGGSKKGPFPYASYLLGEEPFVVHGMPDGLKFEDPGNAKMAGLRAMDGDLVLVPKEAETTAVGEASASPVPPIADQSSACTELPIYGPDGNVSLYASVTQTDSPDSIDGAQDVLSPESLRSLLKKPKKRKASPKSSKQPTIGGFFKPQ